jgi:hypothetical protein
MVMMEIKGMQLKGGVMAVMNTDGEIVTCPKRPGVRFDEIDSDMPWYDTETNEFVCGNDQADSVLRGLLAKTLLASQRNLPDFVVLDPLLKEAVEDAV